MTAKTFLCILFFITPAFSQNVLFKQLDAEISLLKHHGVTTTRIDQNNILLRQENGVAMVMNFKQPEIANADTGDLILTLADLDTTTYYNKYRFMAELPLGDFFAPNKYTIVDANKNGRKEIYGNRMRKTVGDAYSFEGYVGFELGTDTLFKQILFFPDSVSSASGFGDVDGDGLFDIAMFKGTYPESNNYLYTQSSPTSLPNIVKTKYDTLAHQIGAQKRSFFDLDGDGRDETIYKVVGSSLDEFDGFPTVVDRYDTTTKEFKNIFIHQIKDPGEELTYTHGLSFGDFDGDGKMNIGTGSQNGYAYTHEYQGNNVFTSKLIAQVPTKNLYLTCVTNDFNKNGKPEVWYGGDTFFNGTAITRLFAFEATGDDQYQKVYQIDIVGLFSLIGFGMHSRDMDNDGTDELFVHLAQRILIFKSNNMSKFDLWFIKINELAAAGLNSVLWSSDAQDIDGDGVKEIFLETDHVVTQTGGRKFATVFKRNTPTSIKKPEPPNPVDFQLFQNYPNPFNPTTSIAYEIPEPSNVIISVFDRLGREVSILVNQNQSAGYYTATFNASKLSSGVYFYTIKAGSFLVSRKMLLLK